MIMTRSGSGLGTVPGHQLTCRSGHVYPFGLAASRAIRGALGEVPEVTYPHRSRRPPP
jgi:hypothetical protein